ncbi:MAG: metallophosphoesterase [Candidatus Latescibacteria bacterium]|nr:metallophosphoesterase [Candidatus Latescibacterota bacterium]
MSKSLGLSITLLFVIFFFLYGCNVFEYSPYETEDGNTYQDLVLTNISRLTNADNSIRESFKFAFLTDTHADYDEFAGAVKSINNNTEIMFVIHGGDLTDYGLLKEYEWSTEILSRLQVPFFTVIGNHDCLANGKHVYHTMFGETFYSFVLKVGEAKKYKFLFLNDNTLEYEYKELEIEELESWIDEEFTNSDEYDGLFVTAHVTPFSDYYFTDQLEEDFSSLLAVNNVLLAMFGHDHHFYCGEYYNDGVMYLRGEDIFDRNYCIVTVYTGENEKIQIDRVYY